VGVRSAATSAALDAERAGAVGNFDARPLVSLRGVVIPAENRRIFAE
jgi:hypothetical protein